MKRTTDEVPSSPENTPLGGVLDFLKLLWALDHGLQTASRRMESRLGVTGPQRTVIRIVGRFPGISAGELATVLHVHPSTLTGVLKRLEQRQVLLRSADPQDGRRVRFELTDKGREIDGVKTGTVEATVRNALAHLPPNKLKATQDVLRVLVEAFDREE
jgi:DNA-binding MarR family transcriptional regulator